jgi:hypothetical protein
MTCIGHLLDTLEGTCANGLAWAARRELLDQHGFFDACIIGGGDRAMASAAYHCFDELMKSHSMNKRQQDRYVGWAKPFYESVRAEIGYTEMSAIGIHVGVTKVFKNSSSILLATSR